jgi:uncharacterized lipoprotein YddW (UPF0748 family)
MTTPKVVVIDPSQYTAANVTAASSYEEELPEQTQNSTESTVQISLEPALASGSSSPAVTPTSSSQAALPAMAARNNYNTLNFKTQKGFWISYLEYMSALKGKSQKTFTANVDKMFDNVADFGFNTVYVQVRAFGDAYYKSDIFPAGKQISGVMGTIPSAGSSGELPFDPLAIMVKAAHDRGLSIHAWINPMRLGTDAELRTMSKSVPYKAWYDSSKRSTYMFEYNGNWYLNPSSKDCVNLIVDGVKEIVGNYDVDGVQIDDYFYPDDNTSYDRSVYKSSGTSLSQAKWRISNVNNMVKKIYSAVHAVNSDAIFGISPQGSVDINYSISADVKTWCSTPGYCDYILPQIYFGFDNPAVPYADVLSLWSSMVKTSSVKLVIGLAPYKIGLVDNYAGTGKSEWENNDDIIARQMKLAKSLSNYGGVALYRYGSIFSPASDVSAAVSAEVKNISKIS